jgi:hypothetical protein
MRRRERPAGRSKSDGVQAVRMRIERNRAALECVGLSYLCQRSYWGCVGGRPDGEFEKKKILR